MTLFVALTCAEVESLCATSPTTRATRRRSRQCAASASTCSTPSCGAICLADTQCPHDRDDRPAPRSSVRPGCRNPISVPSTGAPPRASFPSASPMRISNAASSSSSDRGSSTLAYRLGRPSSSLSAPLSDNRIFPHFRVARAPPCHPHLRGRSRDPTSRRHSPIHDLAPPLPAGTAPLAKLLATSS